MIPLLGLHLKKPSILIRNDKSTPVFTAVLFTITKIRKQPKCPSVDEWINNYGAFMQYYLVIQKKKSVPSVTAWIELKNITLREISQSEKDKYHMIPLIWNLMNKLN